MTFYAFTLDLTSNATGDATAASPAMPEDVFLASIAVQFVDAAATTEVDLETIEDVSRPVLDLGDGNTNLVIAPRAAVHDITGAAISGAYSQINLQAGTRLLATLRDAGDSKQVKLKILVSTVPMPVIA